MSTPQITIISLLVLAIAYCVNMTYISVFYHRGFTHQAIRLSPWLRRFVIATGNLVTGIDLKAWACMHRMHHVYSDTMEDPHSPKRWGLVGTIFGQLYSYKKTIRGLMKKDPKYMSFVSDLDFEVSVLNRKSLWLLPYGLHAAVGLLLWLTSGHILIGLGYFLGMMSHPIQGWLVNAFGHAVGYRNFNISDDSRNNTLVAWTCFGEGYQNNHHRFPKSAKFSVRWFEFDFGWTVTKMLSYVGALEILSVAKIQESKQPTQSEANLQLTW